MTATTPTALAGSPTGYRFAFHGTGGSFFLIFLKNVLFTLLTLGIYLAWAKTERRQYVWSNASFHGQPFRYTGTGLELFKGYLVVLAGYAVFVGAPALAERISPAAGTALRVALLLALLAVAPLLIFRSRGFLYNRTVWRGIRFGLDRGRTREYVRTFWSGALLTLLTLGLYSPVMTNRLHRVLTGATRFGSLELRYDGRDRDVFWLWLRGLLLSLPTLGLYQFWYRAALTRYQAEHTAVGPGARLRSAICGGDLLGLFLLGAFGTTLTLGLAFPWIAMYSIRLVAERTTVEGVIDFDSVEQRAREQGATSDGFADVLDLDLGI